eukprot:3829084-Amphidinium_carterae.1
MTAETHEAEVVPRLEIHKGSPDSSVELVLACSADAPSRPRQPKQGITADPHLWSERHVPTQLKQLRPRQAWDRCYRWLQKWQSEAPCDKRRAQAILIKGPP